MGTALTGSDAISSSSSITGPGEAMEEMLSGVRWHVAL